MVEASGNIGNDKRGKSNNSKSSRNREEEEEEEEEEDGTAGDGTEDEAALLTGDDGSQEAGGTGHTMRAAPETVGCDRVKCQRQTEQLALIPKFHNHFKWPQVAMPMPLLPFPNGQKCYRIPPPPFSVLFPLFFLPLPFLPDKTNLWPKATRGKLQREGGGREIREILRKLNDVHFVPKRCFLLWGFVLIFLIFR